MIQNLMILERPYTAEEVREIVEKSGDTTISAIIRVPLSTLLSYVDGKFLEMVSEMLIGSETGLADIEYNAVGVVAYNDCVLISVSGDVTNFLEEMFDDYVSEE